MLVREAFVVGELDRGALHLGQLAQCATYLSLFQPNLRLIADLIVVRFVVSDAVPCISIGRGLRRAHAVHCAPVGQRQVVRG